MRTYTEEQNKTKQSKTTQDCEFNSEGLIRPSNLDVSVQRWKEILLNKSRVNKNIIVWCVYVCPCVCVRVYVCACMCVRICVCCVCVTCTHSGVNHDVPKHAHIHSYKRSCMLRSRVLWYETNMFQTQTNMNKPPTWWEGGRGACRVPGVLRATVVTSR